MPRKEGQRNLSVPMSLEELNVVHETARARGFKITSDYVRSLLEKDIGNDFRFDVDRGGWRERTAKDGE